MINNKNVGRVLVSSAHESRATRGAFQAKGGVGPRNAGYIVGGWNERWDGGTDHLKL